MIIEYVYANKDHILLDKYNSWTFVFASILFVNLNDLIYGTQLGFNSLSCFDVSLSEKIYLEREFHMETRLSNFFQINYDRRWKLYSIQKRRMQDIARQMKWTTIIRYQMLTENYSAFMMEFGGCLPEKQTIRTNYINWR